jgi:hypothetical protein
MFFYSQNKKSHLVLPAVPFTKGGFGKYRNNKSWIRVVCKTIPLSLKGVAATADGVCF